MTMHHYTPTARLVLLALRASATPLSLARLSDLTGASPGTLEKVIKKLVMRGEVTRQKDYSISVYSIAPVDYSPLDDINLPSLVPEVLA